MKILSGTQRKSSNFVIIMRSDKELIEFARKYHHIALCVQRDEMMSDPVNREYFSDT